MSSLVSGMRSVRQTAEERCRDALELMRIIYPRELLRGIIESLLVSLRLNARIPQLPPPTFPPQSFLPQVAGPSHVPRACPEWSSCRLTEDRR